MTEELTYITSLNKQKVQDLLKKPADAVENGYADALDALAYLETWRQVAEEQINRIKEQALEEAEKKGEPNFKHRNFKVKVTPSRRTYKLPESGSFKSYVDDNKDKAKEYTDKVKRIEALGKEAAQQGKPFLLYADEDTGEMIEVPASIVTYTKASVKFTLDE